MESPILAAGETSGIEQELVRKELGQCVRGYLEGLPPPYRPVVVLSEEADLKDDRGA